MALLLAAVLALLAAAAVVPAADRKPLESAERLSNSINNNTAMVERFDRWAKAHNRTFASAGERALRLAVFAANARTAAQLDAADPHAQYGDTQFSDLSPQEFRLMYLTYKPPANKKDHTKRRMLLNATEQAALQRAAERFAKGRSAGVPADFDWRSRGVVTPVYNQGQCGSCWAFSVTENVESMWALAGHGLHQLSMQELVDCSLNGNHGCGGGNPPYAYEYLLSAGGYDSLSDYPYTGENGQCRFDRANVVAQIAEWGFITERDDEDAMGAWVYEHGPASVCVDASYWQYYQGGVITRNCGSELDHCVLITGFSTLNGIPAWNVRNSWGASWGEQGYLYIERGENMCGIGDEVTSSECQ